MRNKMLLTVLLFSFISITSCTRVATISPATTVPEDVSVVNVVEKVTTQREITQKKLLDQCRSASASKAEIEFGDLSSQQSGEELVLKGTLRGEAGVSVAAKVILEGAVEKHFSSSASLSQNHGEKVSIDVPPHTKLEYTIVWRELRREGTVTYLENGEQKEAAYSYRIGVELASSTAVDMECTGNTPVGQNNEPQPPTSIPGDPTAPGPAPTSTNNPNTISTVITVEGSGMGERDETDSGQYIQAGDHVSVEYISGQWWIGQSSSCTGTGDPQSPTDAGGYAGRDGERVAAQIGCPQPEICRPLPNAPWGSLLGRIGREGALFHVGNSLEFDAQDSGLLYFRLNYSNHNDVTGCPYGDGGNITVRLKITPK